VKALGCPSCSSAMERRDFERNPTGRVDLDLCFACHALWFDQFESAQLTPGAVLELFRTIHEHKDEPLRPLAEAMRCPRCRERLQATNDVQRGNKLTYYRCVQGHGRLTSFFQFLREKNFVRTLTLNEVRQLAATVKQVRCSSCGGPVNLERDSACGYCRAPISVLDAEAVNRTLAALSAAERRTAERTDAREAVAAVLAGRRYEPQAGAPAADGAARFQHRLNRPAQASAAMPTLVGGGGLLDLVSEALDFLMDD
jgi:Transcription factor zinc-finger